MSKVAKSVSDDEVEFVDEDDGSVEETKKAVTGFTPTQRVSWPWGSATPPKEPEGALDADQRTRVEGAKANRVLANREEAEKARQEDHRVDPGTSIEAKYATGFSRQAGKHTAHTAPLTRGGRLKIFPESIDQDELYFDLEKLGEIAKRKLHGRNATVFEKLVMKPLADGTRHPPVKEVAAQLNIKERLVYKIRDKCWDIILREHNRRQQEKSQAGTSMRVCGICGKPDSSNEVCPRGNDGACDRRSYIARAPVDTTPYRPKRRAPYRPKRRAK